MKHLVVTIAAIACLALATGCGLKKYKCKSKQAEVQAQLRLVVELMEGFKAEKGAYPAALSELVEDGFEPSGQYYDFEIASVEAEGFVIQGTGKGDMAGDVWRIDQDLSLTAESDACK